MSKLRDKLAELLEKQFQYSGKQVSIDANDLRPAQGWYRTSPRADIYRWEGSGTWHFDGGSLPIVLYSYARMTDCVKHGVIIEPDKTSTTTFDIYAVE